MAILIVVNNTKDWVLNVPGVDVVSARAYLSDRAYSDMRDAKVFNLCRSYKYQSIGYYVSLLAEARGHKVFPNVLTIQDLKSQVIMRISSDELDKLIQKSLSKLRSPNFVLSVYFGK